MNEVFRKDSDYFQSRLDEALGIEDQNDRHDEALVDPAFDGLDDFRTLTVGGIRKEQTELLATLSSRDNSPYADLATTYTALDTELTAAQEYFESLSGVDEEQKARLLAAAKRSAELAPCVGDDATALAQERIERLQAGGEVAAIAAKIGQMSLQLSELDALYDVAGQSWPLPRALDQSADSRYEYVDEVPVDPEDKTCQAAQRLERIYNGKLSKASVFTAATLITHAGEIYTAYELGESVYRKSGLLEDVPPEKKHRVISHHITDLMAPSKQIVGKITSKEGFNLQFGWRYMIDRTTGDQVGQRIRIYRVLSNENNPDASETFIQSVDSATGDVIGKSTEETHKEDDRTSTLETLVCRLDTYGLLPKQGNLVSRKKLHIDLIRLKDVAEEDCSWIESLKKAVNNVSNGDHVSADFIVAGAVGGRFGFKLPEREQEKIYRIINGILETYYEQRNGEEAV